MDPILRVTHRHALYATFWYVYKYKCLYRYIGNKFADFILFR